MLLGLFKYVIKCVSNLSNVVHFLMTKDLNVWCNKESSPKIFFLRLFMVVYDLLYYMFKFVLDITFAFAILEPNITYAGSNNMFYSKNLLIFFHHIYCYIYKTIKVKTSV